MKWPFHTSLPELLDLVADHALHIITTLIVAAILRAIAKRAIRLTFGRLEAAATEDPARRARLRTLEGLTASTAGYAIFFVAALMVLGELGLNTSAVLTTAGVLGLAVGLGSQRLVRDVIGGFFILLENQFSVGETVTLGGVNTEGRVEEMGLRVTRLRDAIGRLVIVDNGDITTVTNHSRGPLTVAVDVVLPAAADLEAVRRGLEGALAALSETDWSVRPAYQGLVDGPDDRLKIRVSGQATADRRLAAEMSLRGAIYGVIGKAAKPA